MTPEAVLDNMLNILTVLQEGYIELCEAVVAPILENEKRIMGNMGEVQSKELARLLELYAGLEEMKQSRE